MTAGEAMGLIGLLGSGETAAVGGRLFEALARDLPRPVHVAVLETPAGFELNSPRVAGRVAEFLRTRLGNYEPQVSVIPARQRGTFFSPDDAGLTAPLLNAHLIFAGPGSPTYAARQLAGSLAWQRVQARLALGAAAVFASAAAVAVSRFALPVYEIYKAGHDLHWQDGLDLLGPFGLSPVFVPHWNNSEGGAELDTSRCFMGRVRFEELRSMLPPETPVVGVDEHTTLVIDLERQEGRVLGQGRVTLLRGNHEAYFSDGETFDLNELGRARTTRLLATLPQEVVAEALAAMERAGEVAIPGQVLALADERQQARAHHNWAKADQLRDRIEALGWQIQDTPDGPKVLPASAGADAAGSTAR